MVLEYHDFCLSQILENSQYYFKDSSSSFFSLFFHTETPIKTYGWASLVAQWLRICLLMQGTRVRALVWEDPTCHGAAGPVSHNY